VTERTNRRRKSGGRKDIRLQIGSGFVLETAEKRKRTANLTKEQRDAVRNAFVFVEQSAQAKARTRSGGNVVQKPVLTQVREKLVAEASSEEDKVVYRSMSDKGLSSYRAGKKVSGPKKLVKRGKKPTLESKHYEEILAELERREKTMSLAVTPSLLNTMVIYFFFFCYLFPPPP